MRKSASVNYRTLTLLVCEDKESHDSYQNVFENGKVVEDDCHHAQIPQRSLRSGEGEKEEDWGKVEDAQLSKLVHIELTFALPRISSLCNHCCPGA